jgi:hypothetical protein
MTITNTLKTAEEYRQAGFNEKQAGTMARMDEEHAMLLLDGIKTVFAAEFARIDAQFARINDKFDGINEKFGGINDKFAQSEAKMEAKIESVARDQLFKIVALFLSAAAATIGAVVLVINLSR